MARKRSHVVGRMLSRGGDDAERAKAIICKAAGEYGGNKQKIAESFGVSYVTLYRWCRDHDIDLDAAALAYLEGVEDGP